MATTTVEEYIQTLSEPLRTIATTLRPIIDAGLPDTKVQMWHGQPVWMAGKTPVALLKAYPKYVTFALFRGKLVTDSSGWLESGSGEMASVKLHQLNDIDESLFARWLAQAQALELSTTV